MQTNNLVARLEASHPHNVPKTLCENWKAINRPLCFQGVSSASNTCSMEERSLQCSKNAFSITWTRSFIMHSNLSVFNTGSEQNKKGQDKTNSFDNTMMVNIAVIPPNTEMLIRKSVILPLSIIRKTTNQSPKTDWLSCNKSNPYISGMNGFRGYLFKKVVSVKAANIISNSIRQSSLLSYESFWNKWFGRFDERAVDPFWYTS